MVRLDALDGSDGAREAHGQVQQDVAVGRVRGRAGEVLDVRRRGAGPVEDDVQGQREAAEGVEPPDPAVVAQDGEDDAEGVEDDVGDGVLGQGLHARVLDEAAPEPAAELDDDRRGHDEDGREAEPLDKGLMLAGVPLFRHSNSDVALLGKSKVAEND